MPFLIDRSCPEWQKRDREHRRVGTKTLIVVFVLIIGSAYAIDYFFPPVAETVGLIEKAAD